jgi:hypothetical protein
MKLFAQNTKYTSLLLTLVFLGVAGCTSVNVRPVSADRTIKSVCIRENPKVKVDDFLEVLVAGFARHGITAKVVAPTDELKGEYVVSYVAYRKWDMAPYLCDANIRIEKDGEMIASAEFHLKGGGGFALTKYNSTKTKMDPVIDQLLVNFR